MNERTSFREIQIEREQASEREREREGERASEREDVCVLECSCRA